MHFISTPYVDLYSSKLIIGSVTILLGTGHFPGLSPGRGSSSILIITSHTVPLRLLALSLVEITNS